MFGISELQRRNASPGAHRHLRDLRSAESAPGRREPRTARQRRDALGNRAGAVGAPPRRSACGALHALAWPGTPGRSRALLHPIADCDQAIALQPWSSRAHAGRGQIYAAARDELGALSHFDRALDLDAKNVQALFGRANVFMDRKDYGRAIADYSSMIEVVRSPSRRLPGRPASECGPRAAASAAISSAYLRNASRSTRKKVRIMGSKSVQLRTLVAAESAKTAGFGVPSFVPKWRARNESNVRPFRFVV